MATLLLSTSLISPSSSSSSTLHSLQHNIISLPTTTWNPKSFNTFRVIPQPRRKTLKHSQSALVGQSTLDEIPFLESKSELIASLKLKLLNAVSGLNRGLAANEEDLQKADYAAKELEAAGGLVDLSTNLDILQGRWKLIYSSAFSSRTLGGSRPGPPIGRLLPITLGQVFQRIDILSKDFDNIVELQLGTPWPIPPIEATATLAHKFELIGSAKIKIIFEKTTVKTTGSLSQLPPLELPRIPDGLRPPSNTGSGEFEVTYVDADTRITRGDREELRVFVIA
ncbi:plastid-lipid associated protein PAP / fibrillin family protein [Tasmannia lanceolata]|uniref:plastid-lipid associated protein PAP / fibrillin family protein n=1 Tax=Tasmannia lanceolata TaxID=3420 RepID=UPI0040639011